MDKIVLAIKIAEFLEKLSRQKDDFIARLKTREYEELSFFKSEGFDSIAGVGESISKRNDLFTAYVLFYIISEGRYPQDCWGEKVTKSVKGTQLDTVRVKGNEFADCLAKAGYGDLKGSVKEIRDSYTRAIERNDIIPLIGSDETVGIVKLYEMFWEVFVLQNYTYGPATWKDRLEEFSKKNYTIRQEGELKCEFRKSGVFKISDAKERCGNSGKKCKIGKLKAAELSVTNKEKNVEIYAVSYEGLLDKPGHDSCQDCCKVSVYNEDMWLAVSADGVGSCTQSHVGSRLASEQLGVTISNYLEKSSIFQKKTARKPDHKEIEKYEKLMYYLRFGLASDFYTAWENTVRESVNFSCTPEVTQFSSTMQFAFGCRFFVACGKVGDGTLFVGMNAGGKLIDDGVSGVVMSEVMTVSSLKNMPEALKIDFFRPDEITDIIISSDGVSEAIGQTVPAADKFAQKMRKLTFENRCNELSRVARLCTNYNKTDFGVGDDCTLIHICYSNIS